MSGLEPIAALGLACNILQVIEIGIKTVQLARQLYKDGELDPTLGDNGRFLVTLSDQILSTSVINATGEGGRKNYGPQDQRIVDLAIKIHRAARDLVEEVNFLRGRPTKSQVFATLHTVAKTFWRRKRLEKLEKNLREAEQQLQAGLLTEIYERSRRTGTGVSSVGGDLRAFVDEYRNGRRDAALYVSAEADKTRQHVVREIAKGEKAIKTHVTQSTGGAEASIKTHMDLAFCGVARREDAAALEVKRERLLQSLTFPRMNERRSLVTSSHPGTFRWVLQDGSDNDEAGQDGKTEGSGSKITWDSFVDWLRSTETTYWVSGKPGAGKTTLMKYLMAQPETKQHLRSWNTEAAVVISHFFWRPGNDMQQSIRGLQCSLLHQLFSESPLSMDWVLQGHESIRRKSADTDWSGEELTSTLYNVMSQYPSPVVIFLDGLDEVLPKDGTLQLLHFIEELRERYGKAGKLKLCLGSRREPLLLRKLAASPQLRLEHLTLEDLRQYGHDKMVIPHDYQIIITPNLPFYPPPSNHNSLRKSLVAKLVEKAEGVFLWLCLTITTLTGALHRGETLEDLWHRIISLPGDLLQLYKDMWARADIETPHRRRIAASYLRLALTGPRRWGVHNIFNYMVATNGDARKRLLELDIPTNASANFLIEACKATQRELESTCAGFLQCPPPEKQAARTHLDGNFILLPWYGKGYDGLVPYITQSKVSFLHRTAQDFLLDTAEGRQILSNDNDSLSEWDVYLHHLEARLAKCRLFKSPLVFQRPGDRTSPKIGEPYDIGGILWDVFCSEDLNIKHRTGDLTRLLLQCERIFNEGCIPTPLTLPFDNIHMRRYPGLPHLVGFEEVVRRQNEYWIRLGQCYGLHVVAIWDMILKIVQDRNLDVQTKSELLISLCTLSMAPRDFQVRLDARLSAMRKLLHMGASAIWSGPCPRKHEPRREEIIVVQTPIKALVSSIWGNFFRYRVPWALYPPALSSFRQAPDNLSSHDNPSSLPVTRTNRHCFGAGMPGIDIDCHYDTDLGENEYPPAG
ncbi:hypothetical protein RB598_006458 [Gaeumannomyces tritici]